MSHSNTSFSYLVTFLENGESVSKKPYLIYHASQTLCVFMFGTVGFSFFQQEQQNV